MTANPLPNDSAAPLSMEENEHDSSTSTVPDADEQPVATDDDTTIGQQELDTSGMATEEAIASAAAAFGDGSIADVPENHGRIAELEEEIVSLNDKLVRAIAENDNLRKRAERDKEDTAKFAISGFARDLVGVAENLMRACESTPPEALEENPVLANLYTGVDMTRQELLKSFEKYGIMRIEPIGEKFDHNRHQAVTQVETAEHPAGTVIQVIQSGYVIHDRLLRPAMVAVSKAPTDAPESIDTEA